MNKTDTFLVLAFAVLALLYVSAIETPPPEAPTVVMVHGELADGSIWSKVAPLLQARGFKAVAVQSPLTSLEDDVAATRRVIEAQTGPVVLVGHSWAGSVITQVGVHDQVKALVYVASFAPSPGESSLVGLKDHPTPPGIAHFIEDANGFLTLPLDAIARDFAQDVTSVEASSIASTQRPVRAANFDQRLTAAAWMQKPSWYIVANDDRMIHPDAQRSIARMIGASTTELDTGHVPMLSNPYAVANVISDAARSVNK